MTTFSDGRRRASWRPTRPVTPEVAGPSPVAPVLLKCLQIGTSCCRNRRQISPRGPNRGPNAEGKAPANEHVRLVDERQLAQNGRSYSGGSLAEHRDRNRSPSNGTNPPLDWSPGRWAERVAGVDSPFAVGFGEHKARAFRVGESRRRRVAVDVEVERGVGRARQRVRVETRPALFQ